MANRYNNGIVTVGIDVGFGVTKAVSDLLGAVDEVFPSVYGHAREIKFRAEEVAKKYPGGQITDGEGDWFVGDLAQTQLLPAELRMLRGRTGAGDELGNEVRLRLFKVAMAKLLAGRVASGDVVHVDVVTGLPVDHMRGAGRLKEALLGQHFIESDLGRFIVNVRVVRVMPQPYGVIYSQMLTAAGGIKPEYVFKRSGVLDAGTYTLDGTLDEDGEYIETGSGSVEAGLFAAQKAASEWYEGEFGEKPSYKSVELLLRTGKIRVFGKDIDKSGDVNRWLDPTRNAAQNLASNLWGSGASLDILWLAGGGGSVVEAPIRAAGFKHAVLCANAQLAIARGYLQYGLFEQQNEKERG